MNFITSWFSKSKNTNFKFEILFNWPIHMKVSERKFFETQNMDLCSKFTNSKSDINFQIFIKLVYIHESARGRFLSFGIRIWVGYYFDKHP